MPTRFLNTPTLQAMFVFSRDMAPDREMAVNRPDHPVPFESDKRGRARFHE